MGAKQCWRILFDFFFPNSFILLVQFQFASGSYLRPLSSAVISQSQTLAAQNTTPILAQARSFQTTSVTRDIDSAAKFIGAGAATVGVAGSGMCATIDLTRRPHTNVFVFDGDMRNSIMYWSPWNGCQMINVTKENRRTFNLCHSMIRANDKLAFGATIRVLVTHH